VSVNLGLGVALGAWLVVRWDGSRPAWLLSLPLLLGGAGIVIGLVAFSLEELYLERSRHKYASEALERVTSAEKGSSEDKALRAPYKKRQSPPATPDRPSERK
jgi:hypothetical protein